MADFGITPTGFNRKRLQVLLEELNNEMRSIFGVNLNLTPESPDGQVNGIVSASNADLWELAEEAYNAYNPKAATGVTLSNLVQLNGLIRQEEAKTKVDVTLGGLENTVIPAGSLISVEITNTVFETLDSVIIPASGFINIGAIAIEYGAFSAEAGTLNQIDTPLFGWETVINDEDAVIGRLEEGDVDLRVRRENSVARIAVAIIDSIFAEIRSVQNVTRVIVLENDQNFVDPENGLPPHSVSAIVIGGDDQDIGEALFRKKTLGATPFGNTLVQVEDIQGIFHNMFFSRPDEIPIFMTINLTIFDGFPGNGEELIKQAIVDYANGDLIAGRGFSLQDDVIHSELYTPINSVDDHTVDSMFIGLAVDPTETNDIPISITETSVFTVENIVVNTTEA